MKSYKEKVVDQLKQIHQDNQQLNWYKNKVAELSQLMQIKRQGS